MEGARLQASRLGIRRQSMDLNTIVLEVSESFRAQSKTRGVGLSTHLNQRLVVNADPARLSQVLYNLLSNALKFTPVAGHVGVETDAEAGFAIVRVRDTGVGLTPPQILKLFQPFSQVHDTMQTTRPGTGLGLYISRGIVELHDGRIWAESLGPNQGCTFVFAIPLAPEGP
jgi:signal transduction histidine kinase